METSQSIGKISESLAKAQGQMKPAAFDAQNPHFKSKYATLAAIMEACRPALSANGIAVVQGTSVEGEPIRVMVTTILSHTSGEWIKETISIKPMVDNAQGIGSAITYARRYSLAALVGIVSDEDDDGNAASQPKVIITPIRKVQDKPKAEPAKPEPTPAPTNEPQHAEPKPSLSNGIEKVNVSNPTQISMRAGKIREIFTLSGNLGQTPAEMKEQIGFIIGLGKPITDSSQIKNEQLDLIINTFKSALIDMENAGKKEAA
ncbi:MAG: ERF family protein [Candidatus Ozemobacteraceae bacterium]